MKIRNLIVLTFVLFVVQIINGQQPIDREVLVVKPYEPTLTEVQKINVLPQITDTFSTMPSFNYSITSRGVDTDFEVRPMTAARMVGEPIPKLYKSHLKLGAGNYLSPLFELHMNNLRSKDFNYGARINHLSSLGKVRLDNRERVFAGYADNEVLVYGKKIFRTAVLSGETGIISNTIHHYGYNPAIDTTLEKQDIRQNFLVIQPGLQIHSINQDSTQLNYQAGINYGYIRELNDHSEQELLIDLKLNRLFKDNLVGLDVGVSYFNPSESLDTLNNTLIQFTPWFSRYSNDWRFVLGFNSYIDTWSGSSSVKFFPRAFFQFNVIPEIIVPYLGVEGKVEANHYRKVAFENPFINPGLRLKNTYHPVIGFAGLKGKLSNEISYNLRLNYSTIEDFYMFVNDTINGLGNMFDVRYDNIELLSYSGELKFEPGEKFMFFVKGTYNNYKMTSEQHPWHKPAFSMTFSARYNLRDKILVNADVYGIGKRYAPLFGDENDFIELDGITDINLGIEYRYTKILSAFIRLNNITGAKYYHWNQYPSQRFNFMIGFTYSL